MKYTSILLIAAFVLLTGCASVTEVKIDPSQFGGGGKKFVTAAHVKPHYINFFTKQNQAALATASALGAIPGIGVFAAGVAGGTAGAVGESASRSRLGFTSKEFTEQNNLDDPKNEIDKMIASEIVNIYGLDFAGRSESATSNRAEVEEVASRNSAYPYVLDVSTRNWTLHEGAKEGQFSLLYSAKMSFIETENKKIHAQGLCSYKSETPAVDLSELQQSDISKLHAELKSAVVFCVKQFTEKNLTRSVSGVGTKTVASIK